ncbi:MAG: tubulin-like doman-containing protein [Pirellulales bacterium]
MKLELDVNVEPLPGYRLIERLGTGGYGEVWRAEAPGGLTKAIKFVFGRHDEKRASHEMRALERIRSVRHPFLLSLERIEIADGRLIVVMELADGSIKDRCEKCRTQGLPGIPRDELVCYLRDAADALDFMGQAHMLQHLDIKPENMLLLAGRVKVADFGLVKDVRQSQASLVGGLTPLYAAPEVFRGMPCTHSDQYSLGILYQEMLTGTLPFAGSSAAELTLQHLNDEPNLSALSPVDRYVVSRALAKDPQHRYATCREFVDALSKVVAEDATPPIVETSTNSFVASNQFADSLPRDNSQTDLFDDESTAWNAEPEHRLIELPAPDERLVDLPAIDVGNHDGRPMPTLILGIGGAAGRVLGHFRQTICERYDESAALPSIQMLLVDTDTKALSEASRRDRGLSPDETIHVPLRRPQHYREHSQQLLQWLSRRWLYNIPRSLRTEGLRPLGRLALADHARMLGQRIRRSIVQARDAEAVARSTRTIGRSVRDDAVRVVVVASISGGSGGGMSLDLGYMVRAVLNKMGISNTSIIGIMMHATGGDPRLSELARVNAYSWLTEFHHFQQPENAYPGDASCGLPPHEAGVGAFDDTYLVHLGEQLDAFEFEQATQSVADYLRLSVLSPAQAFLDACRSESDVLHTETSAGQTKVRSFGMWRRVAAECDFCDGLAERLATHVVRGWQSGESSATIGDDVSTEGSGLEPRDANQVVDRLRLTSQAIATNSRSLVEARLGERGDQFLASWLTQHTGLTSGELSQLQAIDSMFAAGATDHDEADATATFFLNEPAATLVLPLNEQLRGEIRRWVTGLIEDPSQRMAGARRATAWLVHHFRAVDNELRHFAQTVASKVADVRKSVTDEAKGTLHSVGRNSNNPCSKRALQYFRFRLDQLALAAATHTVRSILSDAKAISDELIALGREMEHLLTTVCHSAGPEMELSESTEADNCGESASAKAAACLEARLGQLTAEVDQRLQAEFLCEHGGLMPTIMRGGRLRAQIIAKLHEFAGQAVSRALAGVNVMEEVFGGNTEAQSGLRSALAAATPSLVEFGGTRRVLAVLPRDAVESNCAEKLSQAFGTDVTTLAGDDNSLTLCVETGQLSVPYAAVELVQRRRDRVDFAARIHSRTDILWTPLLSVSALSTPCPWGYDDIPSRQTSEDLSKTLVL